ncbi:hypothetical protein D3C83_252310 [compost metagenome]
MEKSNAGMRFSARPTRKITSARLARSRISPGGSALSFFLRSMEIAIATPSANRKNGNTRSVKVHPFHSACASGG